ncbi:MAG: hypothetical protein EZS28_037292 [Streblomastix strix]|uniref:Uncharacterized protein n=1 Tax=Streblomastix strix TaxID=222440 RepID=A0A5J4UB96_9EUKA|nr:MAG: hypothetical protein EZS28_037292 [Streblomastix strix]
MRIVEPTIPSHHWSKQIHDSEKKIKMMIITATNGLNNDMKYDRQLLVVFQLGLRNYIHFQFPSKCRFFDFGSPPVIRRADLFIAHGLTQWGLDRSKMKNYQIAINKITYCNCFNTKHCNSLVPYFVSSSLFDAFLHIDPTGTRFASGPARPLIQPFPFHLFAGLCVLAYFSREGNVVAKGGRGQLALIQVVFHNPTFHFELYHPPCIRRADLFIAHIHFRPRQNPPLGGKSTG